MIKVNYNYTENETFTNFEDAYEFIKEYYLNIWDEEEFEEEYPIEEVREEFEEEGYYEFCDGDNIEKI